MSICTIPSTWILFLLEILLPQDVFQRQEAMHSLLSTGCVHAPSSGHYLLLYF